MRYQPFVGSQFQHSSGRVIALGRLLLATLFLIAIWVDVSQPARGVTATYVILGSYVAFAAVIVVATWNDWWLDARLAGPAHAVDIVLFTFLVLLTEGYTSPFFTFFMFLLLAAAIRWGWHATALTAILLTLLYLIAGLLVVRTSGEFEVQRFVVRTGHLVILSLILIWFGANQWRTRFGRRDEEMLAHPSLDESPLETGLRAAMSGLRASAGVFVWNDRARGQSEGLAIRDGQLSVVSVPGSAFGHAASPAPFIYDLSCDRALTKDADRNLIDFPASDGIAGAAPNLGLKEGLAIPIRSEDGDGGLFLESIPNLATDHIDLGEQIAADIAAHLQSHALLKAAEESAEARSRLTLARDLHDSVVQFLAGAAFRIEAMKRSQEAGRDLEPELEELKQLMMQEQHELRSFITALRGGPLVALNDLADALRTLAGRLSRQWDVQCDLTARPAKLMIPARLHLDAQQLTREAVANAVRHAQARTVTIALEVDPRELRLEIVNDGATPPSRGGALQLPISLKERVDHAGGTLDMARGMGVTKVSIVLPIAGTSH